MIMDDGLMRIDAETGEILDDMDILVHYGMPRRSGRYPWGSGKNPFQRTGDFISRYNEMKAKGMSETEIAREMDILNYRGEPSVSKLRSQYSIAKNYRRSLIVEQVKDMKARGMGATEIGEKLGVNESTIRSYLNESSEKKMNAAFTTAEILKKEIDEKGMIDVGQSVERTLGVSRNTLDNALMVLEMEGYPTYGGRVPQATNKGMQTTLKVVGPPGTQPKDIYNYGEIHQVGNVVSHDGGETFDPKWTYPKSLDSSRIKIRYADDPEGGKQKDGLVELRRGVDDISLGNSNYAQVRILVDGTHYIKGMAVYSDDLPDGVDVIFNTNKKSGTPMLGSDKNNSVLKPIDTKDPNNPFGSLIKEGIEDPDSASVSPGGQRYYYDKNGQKQLSVINKRADEGDWAEWSKELPSQFLSKQNLKLAKQQLDLAKINAQEEFEELSSLTNPTVKKYLLDNYARTCDSAAVHLKAAALPRQQYQVILPLMSIKDDEIYAPNYKDGEKLALVRYPHGGTFEIPIVKVNNKNPEGISTITPNAKDAVGISAKVADRLSGADFDGDTVMVIPLSGKANITSTDPLPGLVGFDPKEQYGPHTKPDGSYKIMTKGGTQMEMGKISNLITDMTIRGATDDEKARAVRHSMVVIDAAKHKLDYKQSELDNDIQALKNKYQGRYNEEGRWTTGASTIISQASADKRVPKLPGMQKVDPETGKLYWDPNKQPETYVDKKGKVQIRTRTSTKMAETDDAMTLVSDARAPVELLYADYANYMKSRANDARKERINTESIKKNPEAAKKYADAVSRLEAQIDLAERNAPRERAAQLEANVAIKKWVEDHPEATSKEIKKYSQQALSRARTNNGAKRSPVTIDDEIWEMIQAGGISENTLMTALKYTDVDEVRKRATPPQGDKLTPAKIAKIKQMSTVGYTNSAIAEDLGISTATVRKYLE